MTLGWPFPKHVFDLHTAYLAATNVLLPYEPDIVRKRQSKKLPDACRVYGIDGWETDRQGRDGRGHRRREMAHLWQAGRRRLLRGGRPEIRSAVRAHAARIPHARAGRSRARAALVELFRQGGRAEFRPRACRSTWHSWNLVQENRGAIIRNLLDRFDPSRGSEAPIYSDDGEWSYERFEQHLVRTGVVAWPRLESGRLDIDGDAFRLMRHVPGIENLHALRDSIGVVARATLPIGGDGRNRPSLFPFCTATGRNAHAKSLYNAHAGMRSFMVFPPDVIGVVLDWRTQEVGVAAALSGDQALMDDYRGGDVYHALAKLCGLTD